MRITGKTMLNREEVGRNMEDNGRTFEIKYPPH